MPFLSGSPFSSASRTASTGLSFAVMPTMSSGKISRIPNTAIATPTVRKIFCQNGDIRTSTVALTTALSKDSETSRIGEDRRQGEPGAAAVEEAGDVRPSDGDDQRAAEGAQEHVPTTVSRVSRR